jgi:APA family basic amino acid/polyamine antiporter
MLPEAGGSASFARHGFNDAAGFTAGWALMLSYTVTIPPYLGYFWEPFKDSPTIGTATT